MSDKKTRIVFDIETVGRMNANGRRYVQSEGPTGRLASNKGWCIPLHDPHHRDPELRRYSPEVMARLGEEVRKLAVNFDFSATEQRIVELWPSILDASNRMRAKRLPNSIVRDSAYEDVVSLLGPRPSEPQALKVWKQRAFPYLYGVGPKTLRWHLRFGDQKLIDAAQRGLNRWWAARRKDVQG